MSRKIKMYKIILEKTWYGMSPTYFVFYETYRYEVMRNISNMLEHFGYKFNRRMIQYTDDSLCEYIYYRRDVKCEK